MNPIDELFDLPVVPGGLPAAAPDIFPPDKFNAGVLVLAPSEKTFQSMLNARGGAGRAERVRTPDEAEGEGPVKEEEEEDDDDDRSEQMKETTKETQQENKKCYSYDGGDTGFLNAFFPQWFTGPSPFRLPFRYNAQRTLHWFTAQRNPGYWNIIRPIKIVHFSSSPKPWEKASWKVSARSSTRKKKTTKKKRKKEEEEDDDDEEGGEVSTGGREEEGVSEKKGELHMLWWRYYLSSQISSSSGLVLSI